MRWDDELLFDLEREFALAALELPVRLHLSVGTLDEDLFERNASMLFRFHAAPSNRIYAGLDLKFDEFDGEMHSPSPMLSELNGLRFVFDPL